MSSKKQSAGLRPVIWLLKQLHNALRSATDEVLEPLGFTASQAALLSALAYDSGLSNAELARVSFVTPQSMVELLRSLEERELIARRPDPSGGRAMPAELTPRGAQQLLAVHFALRQVEARLLRDFSAEERAAFRVLLERCLASLRDG